MRGFFMQREKFSSRLGFILISAGCAIGLGNVWRFPYIVGKYGGAAFVLIYLAFLLILGLPIMVMEFSVGRASKVSAALSFDRLEPKGTKWHWYKYGAMAGNYLLMMFYTTIAGWMVQYFIKMMTGEFEGKDTAAVAGVFSDMLAKPGTMTFFMIIVVVGCFAICGMGLQNGVEKITKVMMLLLLALMVILAARSVTLDGASEGLHFYLAPDFHKVVEYGLFDTIFAAMGQAFFTLSLGIGAIAIFGSYIDKSRSLTGEAVLVTLLDTFVALIAGLIIFPSCFAYGVDPGEGPSLIFITLPNVFNSMAGGRIWGALFFLFMIFAAVSTVIAVFENILSFAIDLTGCSRKKAVIVNIVVVAVLSMPCVLGFNVWSGFMPFGKGSGVLDLEDFLVSNNLLPLGSLGYVLFCTKNGVIKKTLLEQYSRPRQNGVNAITIREDDRVIEVRMTNGNNEIVIANRNGRAIRFHESAVREMGRTATGVRGITLDEDGKDEVIGMICIKDPQKETIMVVSENGYGKRSDIEDYRKTNRGGKGVKTLNITDKTGELVAIKSVTDENDLMIINKSGITIRLKVAEVRIMGRATQGVRLIDLEKRNDQIGSVCKVTSEAEEESVAESSSEQVLPEQNEEHIDKN